MHKVLIVAKREYLAAVKSKAFILTMTMMPLLMVGGLILEKVMRNRSDVSVKRIAVIDRSGEIFDTLNIAAQQRNANDIFEELSDPAGSDADADDATGSETAEKKAPRQIAPTYVLERVEPAEDRTTQLFELSNRVRKGELFAFIDIGPNVLDTGNNASSGDSATKDGATKDGATKDGATGGGVEDGGVEDGGVEEDATAAVRYFSNTPTYRNIRRWLRVPLTSAIHAWRFREAGLDPSTVQWALKSTQVDNLELLRRDETSGEIVKAEKISDVTSFIIPMIMMMMLFAVIMTGAAPLIQSVLEEKTQRIAEVLLAMVTPFQWMLGKLLGSVAVSLTIVTVYFIGGAIFADRHDALQMVPFHLIGWFAAYQVIAVLMFGSIFIGIGAACSDHREAQSAVMPVMILIVIPMMVWPNVIREPSSTFALALSLFPPTTPMLMLVRQSVPPGIPLWQPILGLILSLLTTILFIFAASRVFRVGILMQGKGAGFKDMLRWVLKG